MDRTLTIADVFNPLDSAIKVQQLDDMRTRNRLLMMQSEEYQKTQQAKNDIANMWNQAMGQQGQQPQPQAPQQAQGQPQGQPQQPQGQPQTPNPQMKLQNAGKIFNYAIQTGNDALLQQVLTGATSDPDLAPIVEKMGISSLRTTGTGELEQVIKMTPEKFAQIKQKNPALDWDEKATTVKIVTKNGIITKFEPVKDVTEEKDSKENIVKNALTQKLGRKPNPIELQDGMIAYEKKLNAEKMSGRLIDFDPKWLAQEYAAGNITIEDVKKAASTFGVNGINQVMHEFNKVAPAGMNWKNLEFDYIATKRHIATLNGTQQLRLRQAVTFAYDSLDIVEDLAKQWKGGNFPILNRANLMAAKNGVLGPQAQDIATKLDTQIADLTSELGTVYKGGNTSTDEGLKLAAKNLAGEWAEHTLLSNINLVRKNLNIRKHSIENTGVAGLSTDKAEPEKSTGPEPGLVKDGYKFKGGDPSKKENWEKV